MGRSDKPQEKPSRKVDGAAENYERPSERMFRRSRAAQKRRNQAAQKDARFMRVIFGIAGFALLLVFLFFFMFAETAGATGYRVGTVSWL